MINYDICNTQLIYDKAGGFEYSLPENILKGFLSGKAFDHPEPYTEEESRRLNEDINEIFRTILSMNPKKEKLAVMTAGAPGAGKTIKMRQDLSENKFKEINIAYVCPDDVCLPNQVRTYQVDIASGDGSIKARQAAYNKWRPGSNAATHLILANLIREGFTFYFGTTSSSPQTGKFFEFLKRQGYKIRLLHVTAPDDIRWESIKERDKTFVQTTEQDTREKGFLVPKNIDTFLAHADEIEFYYRDGVKKNAELAAKWTRNQETSKALGTLEIVSPNQYQQIKTIHNSVIELLKRPELYWEKTVEKDLYNKETNNLQDSKN